MPQPDELRGIYIKRAVRCADMVQMGGRDKSILQLLFYFNWASAQLINKFRFIVLVLKSISKC